MLHPSLASDLACCCSAPRFLLTTLHPPGACTMLFTTNANLEGRSNTGFGPTPMETSADAGEANSDGDKRDVKQRWCETTLMETDTAASRLLLHPSLASDLACCCCAPPFLLTTLYPPGAVRSRQRGLGFLKGGGLRGGPAAGGVVAALKLPSCGCRAMAELSA